MKTYILKRPVHNDITFPLGTIVKLTNDIFNCFEVVEGDLSGKVGAIADGIDGWLIDDTFENRILTIRHIEHRLNLDQQMKASYSWADKIPEPDLAGTIHEKKTF